MVDPAEMVVVQQAESVPAPAEEQAPAPTVEQVQAADAVFTSDPEGPTVAGVIGLWGGAKLLHDLALDHLTRKQDEEDEARKR